MVRSSVLRFVERSTGGTMGGSLVSCACWYSLSGPAKVRCGVAADDRVGLTCTCTQMNNAGRTRCKGGKTVKVAGGGQEQVVEGGVYEEGW
ncbi:hypothetical protein CGRA01v4_07087 [Colletotrichum graminicola]|nr:hypothetical protein CGRA01v4_07087 [Colletotrichum graminicola]